MASFYVYELIDPRDGGVFYVGKGKGSRLDCHEKEAANGKPGEKAERIRDIWASGLSVVKRKVATFSSAEDALRFEAAVIAQHGLHNLTNVQPGGGKAVTVSRADDREFVAGFAKLLNRTGGFAVGTVWVYGAVKVNLAPAYERLANRLQTVVGRRGHAWVNKIGSEYNVRFT